VDVARTVRAMSFAAFLVAFAIAAGGNPSSVSCNPDLTYNGLTFRATHAVEISPRVCGGLLLLQASARERERIRAANSLYASDVDEMMALGALTLAHEAQHAAGILDEGEAQCRAVRLAPSLLGRYLSGIELADAVQDVSVLHARDLPPYNSVC
jgi:hypothetical protein